MARKRKKEDGAGVPPAPPIPTEIGNVKPAPAVEDGPSLEEQIARRLRGERVPPPAPAPRSDGDGRGEGSGAANPQEPVQPSAPVGRPSLGELAVRTNGWDCPRCGCRDWRVINSYLCADGTRHRRQFCRHCYFSRITVEAPAAGEGAR